MLRPQGLTLAVASERVILTEHVPAARPAWPVLCMDGAVGRRTRVTVVSADAPVLPWG